MATPSRLAVIKRAVRPALDGRIMISGPSGSGKTRTALIIARTLSEIMGEPDDSGKRRPTGEYGKVLGIDTERESMLTYADDFDFEHLKWEAPFSTDELAETITQLEDTYRVIIVDSVTHFWRKEGGILSVAGGKYTNWDDARKVQDRFVQAVLKSKAHVILCARAKMQHSVEELPNGKQKITKIGMGAIQDDDLEYELNVGLEASMTHDFTATKSRSTAIPVGQTWHGGQVTEMAETYRDWLLAGEPPAPTAVIKAMIDRMNAIENADMRKDCKNAFVAAIGRPEQLRDSAIGQADALITRFEADPVTGEVQAKTETPAETPADTTSADDGADAPGPGEDDDTGDHSADTGPVGLRTGGHAGDETFAEMMTITTTMSEDELREELAQADLSTDGGRDELAERWSRAAVEQANAGTLQTKEAPQQSTNPDEAPFEDGPADEARNLLGELEGALGESHTTEPVPEGGRASNRPRRQQTAKAR